MPTWSGSYIGQVVRNGKSYDANGAVTKRWWVWDGQDWCPYERPS